MKYQDILSQIKVIASRLSLAKKITLAALVGLTIFGLILVMVLTGRPNYQVLYSGLSEEDSGVILEKLRENKIPFQIASAGGSIMVPKESVYETRMMLASQGLPQGGGIGFEIFDGTKLGMSEFVQNINFQRAMQGELSRTINQIEEVESSRVHLVMAAKSLFVEDEEPAQASVVLKLKPRRKLRSEQILGIVHLVSSSVSGLKPDHVTIVDNFGKMLSENKQDANNPERKRTEQLEYQNRIERGLESRVMTMLEQALGPGKAIVRVSCALDFRQQEKTEERYYPDNKVVRSEQLYNESSAKAEKTPMGVPGSQSEIAEKLANNVSGNNATEFQKQDHTTNYEIGKLTSHTVEPVGKMTGLSVAVLVDGTYKKVSNDSGVQWDYVPRSPDEMNKLKSIVMRSVNLNESRGDLVEVVNISFSGQDAADLEEKSGPVWIERLKQYSGYVQYGFSLLFLLLTFVFVIRPLIQWITGERRKAQDASLIGELPKSIQEIENEHMGAKRPLPMMEKASQFLLSDNPATIQLLRDWLKQEQKVAS